MSKKIEVAAIDDKPIDLVRRGFLARLGLAAAAAPVLMTLSRAGYASSDHGGQDGHDGEGHGDGKGHGKDHGKGDGKDHGKGDGKGHGKGRRSR